MQRGAWRERLRNLAAGLPPGGDVVSPLRPDDRYVVMLAVYGIVSERMGEGRVLDLGCGVGAGSAVLAEPVGRFVLGVDRDRRLTRFARRRFRRERLDFTPCAPPVPALEDLGEKPFDAVVTRERLRQGRDPETRISALASLLAPEGALFATVAPIALPEGLERARTADPEGTHLFAWYWRALLASAFEEVELIRILPPPGEYPDFASRGPSRLDPTAFVAESVEAEALRHGPALDLLLVARRPRSLPAAG